MTEGLIHDIVVCPRGGRLDECRQGCLDGEDKGVVAAVEGLVGEHGTWHEARVVEQEAGLARFVGIVERACDDGAEGGKVDEDGAA